MENFGKAFPMGLAETALKKCMKNGSNGARTHDLSRVRRTLIPAELCFHVEYYSTPERKCKDGIKLYFRLCIYGRYAAASALRIGSG